MKGFNAPQAILVAAITVAATVFVLDYYGFIHHSRSPAGDEVTVFHAITLGAGQSLKLTIKPSPHSIACRNGYATVVTHTPTGGQLTSILVDANKRGVRCADTKPGGEGPTGSK